MSDIINQLDNGSYIGSLFGQSNKAYHACHSYYSSTALKFLHNTSPLHFYHKGHLPPMVPTYEMNLGSAVHDKMSGCFDENFYVAPKIDLRTKEGKAQKLHLISQARGREIIDEELNLEAEKMFNAVMEHKPARELLAGCQHEVSYFWQCPFTGLKLRSRLDALGSNYFIELKTTRSAHPSRFQRQVFDMHYDLSLYHYYEGLRHFSSSSFGAYFIAVESFEPYHVQCYKVSDELLNVGHDKWLAAVTKLETGLTTGYWPGYEEEDYALLLPPKWAAIANVEGDDSGV